jgi:hypothetical protein
VAQLAGQAVCAGESAAQGTCGGRRNGGRCTWPIRRFRWWCRGCAIAGGTRRCRCPPMSGDRHRAPSTPGCAQGPGRLVDPRIQALRGGGPGSLRLERLDGVAARQTSQRAEVAGAAGTAPRPLRRGRPAPRWQDIRRGRDGRCRRRHAHRGASVARVRANGLTLHRLGVFRELGTSLTTTNALESIHACVESRVAKVDHWRHSEQKQR